MTPPERRAAASRRTARGKRRGACEHRSWYGVAAAGGLGVAPDVWRITAIVSVLYATVAWMSTRSPRTGLTRMIWLNRAWVVVCVVLAIAVATGLARLLFAGEAAVVGALSVWEARVRARRDQTN